MGLEYYSKKILKSWVISLWGRRISFGFWLQVVTDRVVDDYSKHAAVERPYEYGRLAHENDIRLLKLAPGSYDDPLHGRLIHNPSIKRTAEHGLLDWEMQYDALSYVWGKTGQAEHQLILDHEYSFNIGANLDLALRKLRPRTASRILWVDAICINQDDWLEKSTQVALMLDVYARAEKVEIWLGPTSADSAIGIKALQYLTQVDLREPAPWEHISQSDFAAGLDGILKRQWFERIWVVQEACVSQKAIMTCGDDSFQWENDPIQILKFMRRIKYVAISPQWE